MKKFKNWTKKPITWGGYLKLCGVSTVISLVMMAPLMIGLYKDNKALESYNFEDLDDVNELD